MAHISFDSSNLTKFVNDNELGEMQALVTAVDKELREGTGAGNDFRGFLNLTELKKQLKKFNLILKF